MTTAELKAQVEEYRAGLRAKAGAVCQFSETGPVGMSVIDALVATIAAQQSRIEMLETKVSTIWSAARRIS